jgi:hypothetical protein
MALLNASEWGPGLPMEYIVTATANSVVGTAIRSPSRAPATDTHTPVAAHAELLAVLQALPRQLHQLRAHTVVESRHTDLATRPMQATQQLHQVSHRLVEHAAVVAAVQIALRARHLQAAAQGALVTSLAWC